MTTRTTNHLSISLLDWLRWYHQRLLYALVGLAWLVTLVLIARTLQGPRSAVRAVPTPALPITSAPIVVIQRAPTVPPLPTATPDTRILEELAALRQQVADLQAAQAAPVYVDRTVYVNQPVEAAPTADATLYQVASEPPTMAPQQLVLLDRGAWAAQAQEHRGQP